MTEHERREVWRTEWKWPWLHKEHTAEKALLGLGRMHDRLQRCHVWVHNGNEKYKPSLEEGRGRTLKKETK